jgi:HAD superfamily hydrolase (TIGR01509 family)
VAIRGLLFDFDGLLLDTEHPHYASWQEVYREHGQELPVTVWGAAVGTLGGFDPVAHLEELTGRRLDLASAIERRRHVEMALLELEELRPGVQAYLDDAHRLGLKTAIVSSGRHEWIDGHLRRLELPHGWDLIRAADGDVERAKPAPTLYLEALETLGLESGEAVAFEDSPNGVRAAQAAGIFCVAVPNRVTSQLGLDHADLVLDSLEELPLEQLLRKFQ